MQVILDYIVLIAAVLIALERIWSFIKKPSKKLHDEIDKEIERKTPEIVNPLIQEMREQNAAQNEKIDQLILSSRDILRREIVAIYDKWCRKKVITFSDKELVDYLYRDYKLENGNSFIDGLYQNICTWEIVPNDYEI